MDRFARGFAFALLLVTVGLAGCGGSGAGLLTGATAAAPDAPGTLKTDDPLARPIAVAWTSARAQRCGFRFDPAKLRASYLAYEAGRSPPDQLAKAEKTYDSTFKTIRERVGGDPEYCTDHKSAEIKQDLTRHLAGDFKADFPVPKKEESCGFFGCPDGDADKWDSKKFWEDTQPKGR
ncbi:MAG: hypothetical protein WAN86_24165 [Hyphomicrobiaceae bacterium]